MCFRTNIVGETIGQPKNSLCVILEFGRSLDACLLASTFWQAPCPRKRALVNVLSRTPKNIMLLAPPWHHSLRQPKATRQRQSPRTLARKLSDEGLNFTEIFQQLRRDLAVRYLDDRKLHVSKIAWLLGFHEVGAFTHAFKRWTGKTPISQTASNVFHEHSSMGKQRRDRVLNS